MTLAFGCMLCLIHPKPWQASHEVTWYLPSPLEYLLIAEEQVMDINVNQV